MALSVPIRHAEWMLIVLVVVTVCRVSAVVGPDDRFNAGSIRSRELPYSACPTNCFCSPNQVRCRSTDEGIPKDFNLPRRTRILSFDALPDLHFEGTTILPNLHELRWLRISGGELLSFPSLPSLPSLIYLDLSNNNIQSFDWNDLNNTLHLVNLNLSGNALSNLGSSESLLELTDLKILDLSRNSFILQLPTDFFTKIPNIKFIDLSYNNISSIQEEWSKDLQQLHFLNLSHNNIASLPHLNLEGLEVFDLSHNPLLTLPQLAGFPYLKQLLISHTVISSLKVSDTQGCSQLQVLDISYSNLTNLDEAVLSECKHFVEINFSHSPNLWRVEHGALSGLTNLTVLRLNDCPKLYDLEEDSLNGLVGLKELYLQDSGVKVLPYSINQLKNLSLLNLEGTSLYCNCYAHWLPKFLFSSTNHSWKGVDVIHCNDGIDRTPEQIDDNLRELECAEVEVYTEPNQWVLASWGQSALLECNVTGNPTPKIIWQTVDQQLHVYNKSMKDHPWVHHHISEVLAVAEEQTNGKFEVLQSGQLLIRDVTREDIGRYKCFAFNAVSNSSVVTFLGLEDTEFRAMILESILFGFACAALFLLITLLVQFIQFVMERLGWECCCCKNRLSPKAKQIRQLIESVETYKTAQLDKLRENYTSQVVNIKDSCYQQMERLRDSYAQQSKNLKDLCDFSTQHITGARDQYLDQVNKVRDYSMGQMNRVRENYVFQRHRIRKFSGHQLLRLRETYKYQQKTLNKLLETLPDLYIQNCRTGSCQRTDSIVFDNEIDGLDVYYKVDFLDAHSFTSDYYTPNSTLTRQSKKLCHSRNASTTSGGTEYQEAHSHILRQESIGSDKVSDNHHSHNRSNSIATPPSGTHLYDGHRGHKRSISASSHPSPQHFFPKPPLMEETVDNTSLPSLSPTSNTRKSSSSKEATPLYTPLTLTPVHDPKCFEKKHETLNKRESGTSNNSQHSINATSVDIPEHNNKSEVQNKSDCDSESAECGKNNCDTDQSVKSNNDKPPFETSL